MVGDGTWEHMNTFYNTNRVFCIKEGIKLIFISCFSVKILWNFLNCYIYNISNSHLKSGKSRIWWVFSMRPRGCGLLLIWITKIRKIWRLKWLRLVTTTAPTKLIAISPSILKILNPYKVFSFHISTFKTYCMSDTSI